jgi:hypothetical protein
MKNLFYLFVALMISQNVLAVEKFWTGATSTDWNTASNWSPNGVPTSSDYVYINGGIGTPILSTTTTVINVTISNNKSFTISSSARLNTIGDGGNVSAFYLENANLVNNGTIAVEALGGGTLNYTDVFSRSGTNTFVNNGVLIMNSTAFTLEIGPNSSFTNNSCGKIYSSGGGSINNNGTITNFGLFQIENNLSQNSTFTNSGVLKYGSKTGTVTNSGNGSVIVNNTPTPIFTYVGTYNGTVNGIFTNTGATTSAGTFTAPNTFAPSGTLPAGSQTLYAKITPSGGACFYVVPFTYNYVVPPTLTAGAITNATTCGGATGSIAFTTTNVPNGTYALTFTTTGISSPKNVTVSGNAFTLSGLTAGSYNSFSLTVSGQTATTGVLSPAKTVANPATPTLTVGTTTNPTTCAGTNGSIAFTSTNLPNGTYSLSFTASGAGATTSPQNGFSDTFWVNAPRYDCNYL